MLRLGMGIWSTRRGETRVSNMPSDIAMLPIGVRAIYVGIGGLLVYWISGCLAAISVPVLSGKRIDAQVTRVMATGATASQIEAVY